MRKLKPFLLALVLFFLPLHYSFADYYVTEEQMAALETELNLQLELLDKQKKQIDQLQNQLNEANQSLKKSENKNLKNKIIIGGVSVSIGVTVGLIIANCCK